MDVSISYSGDHIETMEAYINGVRIEDLQSIHLSAIENGSISYTIEAYVEDLFHQKAAITKTIHIDTLIPEGTFLFGNNPVKDSISFIDLLPIEFKQNKAMTIVKSYVYEGKEYQDLSLEEMLMMMQENTSMISTYVLSDAAGNTTTITMTWINLETVLETVDTGLSTQNVVYERVWEEDENHNLIMKSHSVKIQDKTKPKISILQNNQQQEKLWKYNDICRITIVQNTYYSNDRFTSLKINGKEIKDFKKDTLANMYYEFPVKGIYYSIEIQAIDDSDNVTTMHKTIFRIPIVPMLLVAFVLWAGWKYREKSTRTR